MPCRYVIDRERRLVITTGTDRPTFAEMKAIQDQLESDPDFDPSFNQLIDMTRVTTLDLSVDEAKVIANRQHFSTTSRRAFVATGPAIFGMGRLMEAYHSMAKKAAQVSVFSDREAALEWLGLKTSPPKPL